MQQKVWRLVVVVCLDFFYWLGVFFSNDFLCLNKAIIYVQTESFASAIFCVCLVWSTEE